MKRDLESMAARAYDMVIIGGGITGACVARDAAMRGLSVALLEKGDFAGATTSASSKLIHGGLRYLQNLELGLVRESLRERRIWSNTAPHMIDPLEFLAPAFRKGFRDRMIKTIAFTLYDWLAYDRNRLDDPEKSIPAHKQLSREEVLALEPALEAEDLSGAMLFYDYQMYSPERLALECIMSAVEAGADAANYAEVTEIFREEDRVTGLRVIDRSPGIVDPDTPPREYRLTGKIIVNAAGPWADLLMAALHHENGQAQARRLIRSKGIHLLTRPITKGHAIAVIGENTHFFILPWRGYSILGTTDTVYEGDPDDVHVTEKDIVDFLAVVNKGYPGARLLRSDVMYFYAGLRPLVDTSIAQPDAQEAADSPDSYRLSRASEVYDHEEEEGLKGLVTVIGGKWTTSRNLAQQVVDLVMKRLALAPVPCTTADTPTYGGDIGPFADYCTQVKANYPDLKPELAVHLARYYGSKMERLVSLIREDPALAEPLCARFPEVAAQVVHAVREEMALSIDDILLRRTGLGTVGSPGEAAIARVAEIMADELDWTPEHRNLQIDETISKFVSWARTTAVVNPHSWGDRTGLVWPEIEARLRRSIGPIKVVFTDAPMAATRLTTEALKQGMEQIIAVGGDGTVNEVVNGFFEDGRPINPEAILAILTSGTGRDFGRTFDMPLDIFAQVERLATSEVHAIDLGKLTFINENGAEETRYFDNIASFGLSGATDQAVNRLTYAKKFGGKSAFWWGMFKALTAYRNQPVHLKIDDAFDQIVNVTTVAVCNGRYFGGSMHIAPRAKPDDGLFDVIMVADVGRLELLLKSGKIYRGEHLGELKVTALRGRKITAIPVDGAAPVLLDVDGEAPGRLPATFEILPKALFLRY
jgi:glycerol-3-phosphate dehydrogenase